MAEPMDEPAAPAPDLSGPNLSGPNLSGSVGALSAALVGAALDMAGLAVIITDAPLAPPGPAIRYANAHFEAVTGYAAAELLGRTPRLLQGPETDRAVLSRLRQSLEESRHFIGATTNYRKDGTRYLNEWVVLPILGLGGAVTHWLSIQRDATREGRPHAGAEALRARTAALLDSVRTIATHSLTAPGDEQAFNGRLEALGRAQALAGQGGADLATLLRGETAGLDPAGMEGPDVALPPGLAEPLALALHELAAQAGAASRPAIRWQVLGTAPARRLHLVWHQPEGPRPGEAWPLIKAALAFALGAETRVQPEAEGFTCRIELPLPG